MSWASTVSLGNVVAFSGYKGGPLAGNIGMWVDGMVPSLPPAAASDVVRSMRFAGVSCSERGGI